MIRIILFTALLLPLFVFAQPADEANIHKVLDDQTKAWNNGNIDEFMKGYWANDSLMFIGQSGITWGWQKTLENYKKHYRDTTNMGKLSFDILIVKKLSADYYYVVGKWLLTRSVGNLNGYYNLLFKKINGRWVIIADHSS